MTWRTSEARSMRERVRRGKGVGTSVEVKTYGLSLLVVVPHLLADRVKGLEQVCELGGDRRARGGCRGTGPLLGRTTHRGGGGGRRVGSSGVLWQDREDPLHARSVRPSRVTRVSRCNRERRRSRTRRVTWICKLEAQERVVLRFFSVHELICSVQKATDLKGRLLGRLERAGLGQFDGLCQSLLGGQ